MTGNPDMFDKLTQEADTQIEALTKAVERFADGEGKPPAFLIASADQQMAAGGAVTDALLEHITEHRAERQPCCEKDDICIGMPMMLAVSTIARVEPAHMIVIAWTMLGRLANYVAQDKPDE